MPIFHYYGRDKQGKAVSGDIEHSSDVAVALYLSDNNITAVDICLKKPNFFDTYIPTFNKVNNEQLILFSRQMHTIFRSGLPINTGLDGLINSLETGLLKKTLLDVDKQLKAGVSLSAAMKTHSLLFNNFFTGMVAIGESSGQLKEVFEQIGKYLERELAIKKNIKMAVRYPCFVLFSIIVALITINFWVVPAFSELFYRLETQLPLATRLLLWMSNATAKYSWLLFAIIVLFFIAFRYYKSTKIGQLRIDKIYYTLPFIGNILYKAAIARYAHSLSALLKANITLNKAIELAAGVIDNCYFKKQILMVKTNIEKGESLYNAHNKYQIFSPLILQMVYLGEQTASLDDLLDEVAESYEREIDYDIKRMSTAIEPLLISILAVFVGVLALGVFLPMWSLFETNV